MTWDRRTLPIAATLALLTANGFASPPPNDSKNDDAERIISTARQESKVTDHLDHLANRIGPRLTGSHGLQDACDWAVERFQSFGIANARLERWGEFPVGFNRGQSSGRMVEPSSRPLTFGTNSWTAGTRGPTRGPALLAPESAEELEAIKDKLPGAYVLAFNTPGTRISPDFRALREAAYAEAKIAGVVRSTQSTSEVKPPGSDQPVKSDLIVTGGNYKQTWDKLPTVPAIDLVKIEFDEIVALLKYHKPVTLEFDIRNYFEQGPIALFNVVAEIPGTEHPDEFVIVGGHIDSWDGASGTTDNGTGCATTLEVARLIMTSGVKPKRTIQFMLWSGEEQGLLGSRAYVKAHPDLMPKISAVLVHDGGTNYLSGIGGTEAMQSDLNTVFAPALDLDAAMPFAVTQVPGLRGGGSDHASFLTAGVPGFFWGQRGGTAVYKHTHHTQYDTFDAAIPAYQKHSAIIVALGALGIANLDHLLSREKMTAPGGNRGAGGNRRTMGVQLEDTKVIEVVEGGMAEKAGIKGGDLITKVGDRNVETSSEVSETLQAGGPEVTISLIREGKTIEIKLNYSTTPTTTP